MHERKREVDGLVLYHEHRLQSIAVCFKSDVQLGTLDDAVTGTPDTFGDERPEPSPGSVVESVPTVSGDEKGDWNFGDVP